MEKNKKIGLVVGGLVVLVLAFYGGMSYGKSQVSTSTNTTAGGMYGGGTRTGRGGFGGGAFGQIISKDANSITLQLMAGGAPGASPATQVGSKIIFLDSATKISKSVTGTVNDLVVGTQVSVNGTPNSDGSVNAQSVQIRPNMPQGAKVQ